ncbi:molybdopterin-synthase adenylyltransferase MoeB [Thermoleophilia bacterium SCSIO 60948]|nr:molybdopterin-synthase adenylyltransferase MoeB [Thermoleophilia bacterium SCSIO 60948]
MAATEPIEAIKERIEEVEVEEADREVSAGEAILVDVRERNEWDAGHVEASTLVPQAEVADRLAEVAPDQSQRVLFLCASGNRSARAADLASELGYTDVASVRGGFTTWSDRGLATVEPEGLTRDQRMRYSRHTLLDEVGVEGQLKLLNAKVLLLGAGGLGAPTALYLAAAGVGTIGIVDDDVVDESNLQRQVIHSTKTVGEAKTASAKQAINDLNPDIEVIEHNTRLDASNILDLIEPYDILVDGADNFPTRYLLNDASVRLRKPVVSASILGFEGQISTFVPYEGPCYRCLFPTPPPPELAPSCGANGVLGVMAGVMGLFQANEVIKLVVGIGEPLVGRLVLYDSLGTRLTELKVRRDPECPICGPDAPEIDESEMGQFPDYELFCGAPAREETPQAV